MTSKSLFLISSKENHRRRILAWIVSILVQLAVYPGIMTIYLSRIHFWNADGAYTLEKLYRIALENAVTDALGFKPLATVPIMVLAVYIAVQGFSYLHSRRKIDLYHSVPVSARRRFVVIYGNGLVIYLLPAVCAALLGVIMGAAQGALTARGLAEGGLAFLMTFMYFLVVYTISVLAVMLTGNMVITGFAAVTMLFIGFFIKELVSVMRYNFFDSVDYTFAQPGDGSCVVMQYLNRTTLLKNTPLLSEIAPEVFLLSAKWLAVSIVVLALAYLCYRKRPSEAAGKAIAIQPVKPVVKIIISVVMGIFVCYILYDATYYNKPVVILGMVGGTLLCCGLMEIIYEFDIRAVFKHLFSTGISAVAVIFVFCIYHFDLFGYDSWVPDADEVESVAVDIGPYQSYWEYTEEGTVYISSSQYLRDNMFLKDVEAVCKLAEKSVGTDVDTITNYLGFSILYRMKSGKEVSRYVGVDLDNPASAELLNRIIGTEEYRSGIYQIVKDETTLSSLRKEVAVSYTNGAITSEIAVSEAEELRDAWIRDMEQFDYSFARDNRPCGMLILELKSSYRSWELPVYESFASTIAFLEKNNAYYPITLRAEDIAGLEITNWHYDDQRNLFADSDTDIPDGEETILTAYATDEGGVVERFEDPEEIAEIIKGLYPSYMDLYWNEREALDHNYDVVISFKADTEYPYGLGYYSYDFLSGEVPDFVVERTAYKD